MIGGGKNIVLCGGRSLVVTFSFGFSTHMSGPSGSTGVGKKFLFMVSSFVMRFFHKRYTPPPHFSVLTILCVPYG